MTQVRVCDKCKQEGTKDNPLIDFAVARGSYWFQRVHSTCGLKQPSLWEVESDAV